MDYAGRMASHTPSRHLLRVTLLLPLACDSAGGGSGSEATGFEATGSSSGGAATSDESGTDDEASTGSTSGCGAETTTVLTDPSAPIATFDVSATELLDAVAGSYVGELTWRPNDGPVTVTHAEQSSALTVTIGAPATEVRLIEVELHGAYPFGNEGGAMCSNRVEIDTLIDFATDDGTFAERWPATLRYGAAFGEPALSLYHAIDFAAHQGTLAESDFTFEGAAFRDLIVTAGFTDDEVSGSVFMEVEGDGWIGAGDVANYSAQAG